MSDFIRERAVSNNAKKFLIIAGVVASATAVTAHVMRKKAEKTTYIAEIIDPIPVRKMGLY